MYLSEHTQRVLSASLHKQCIPTFCFVLFVHDQQHIMMERWMYRAHTAL